MIIKPKIKGFICTTAHPKGCRENIEQQVSYALSNASGSGSKYENVLIIGASAGYGLGCRIISTFSYNAKTIGVFFDREPSDRGCGTPGWYNTAYFEEACARHGKQAWSINGDAFSHETKKAVIEKAHRHLGKIDLVIYSVAAPRRKDPDGEKIYYSRILPTDAPFTGKTVDIQTGNVYEVTCNPATEEEISDTVKVMGGEDWYLWIKALFDAELLSDGAATLAFSYIGPEITHPIYLNGTIGRAKDDLFAKAGEIDRLLGDTSKAFISVNKALVTQASSAIPVVPLYISVLYKVMKEKGVHENSIMQCRRLFENLSSGRPAVDESGRLRLDDLEMRPDIQRKVKEIWDGVTTENIEELTDIAGYRQEFLELFGFRPDINSDSDVDQKVRITSIDPQ